MGRVRQITLVALLGLLFAFGGMAQAEKDDDTESGPAGVEAQPGVQAGEEAEEGAGETEDRQDVEVDPEDTGAPGEEARPGVQAGEEAEEKEAQ